MKPELRLTERAALALSLPCGRADQTMDPRLWSAAPARTPRWSIRAGFTVNR